MANNSPFSKAHNIEVPDTYSHATSPFQTKKKFLPLIIGIATATVVVLFILVFTNGSFSSGIPIKNGEFVISSSDFMAILSQTESASLYNEITGSDKTTPPYKSINFFILDESNVNPYLLEALDDTISSVRGYGFAEDIAVSQKNDILIDTMKEFRGQINFYKSEQDNQETILAFSFFPSTPMDLDIVNTENSARSIILTDLLVSTGSAKSNQAARRMISDALNLSSDNWFKITYGDFVTYSDFVSVKTNSNYKITIELNLNSNTPSIYSLWIEPKDGVFLSDYIAKGWAEQDAADKTEENAVSAEQSEVNKGSSSGETPSEQADEVEDNPYENDSFISTHFPKNDGDFYFDTGSTLLGRVIANPSLNVRELPSTNSDVIGELQPGEEIVLYGTSLGSNMDWFIVIIKLENGQSAKGYISAEFVDLIG